MKKLLLLLATLAVAAAVGFYFWPGGYFQSDRNYVPEDGYQVGETVADFQLKNVDGKMVSLADNQAAKGYIVVFTCNTCPYAQAYEDRIKALHQQYASKGYPVVAINPNNSWGSFGDSFASMQERAKDKQYAFPYLHDETQNVAQAFGATRTPHVYVLQRNGSDFRVAYIGAIDNNTEDAQAATARYVEQALTDLMTGKPAATNFTKAIGCTIKWKKKA